MSSHEIDAGRVPRSRGRPRSLSGDAAQNTIKSLDRAMEVFEHLSASRNLTLSALAAASGQSPATVYRILITLEKRGFVEFDPGEQVWNIGPRAFTVGARFLSRTSLVDRARPILRRLMEETGETASIGIEKGGRILHLSQVETDKKIRAYFPLGALSPMHVSGIGKVLLAHTDVCRFERWLAEQELERFTDKTICEPEALRAELELIRQRGFSVDNEENSLGMRCFAAPVFDMNREAIAGVSVSGPTSRVSAGDFAFLSSSVMIAAAELTQATAGEPPKPAAKLRSA